MSEQRKKICFVVAVPMTASAFLQKHFEVLASEFDIYLVANFEGVNSNLKDNPNLKGIYSAGIQRDIELWKDFKGLLDLRNYFKKMAFDAVLTVTPKAGFLGMQAANWVGVPLRVHIFTGQVWHTKTGIFRKILMAIDRLTFRLASEVLVDGKAQQEFLIENEIITNNKSRVLGKGSISGVDETRFVPDASIRKKFREELGYSDQHFVFMFLGRLNVDKGILDLAKAFNKLQKTHKNARLLLVGYDEESLMPQINQLVEDQKAVYFFGPTSKPNDLLQASDVFCLPSYREGFGTSVIEAALMEKPVLCSDTYGLKETILDNKTGLRHKTANPDSIFEKMDLLISDQDMAKKLGSAGRQYVLENFTAIKISTEWLRFFRERLK